MPARVRADGGHPGQVSLRYPPGSPQRPPAEAEIQAKLTDCLTGLPVRPADLTWPQAAGLLRTYC